MLTNTLSGNGDAIVFLHGFCESKSIWSDFIAFFEQKYKIICLDLPGFGQNPEIHSITIENMANAVKNSLDHLNVTKAIFVGHSLGGYVALAIADLFPEYVVGLCLFNSTSRADSQEKKEARDKTIQFIKQNGVRAFLEPFVPPLFHPKKRKACANDIQNITQQALHLSPKSIEATILAMKNRPDRSYVLEKAPYPVCIIAGRDDGAVPLENTISFSFLPGTSQILLLQDTAHMAMFENKHVSQVHLYAYFESIYQSKN